MPLGRPPGTYGPVCEALLRAAEASPGTCVQLAQRAQVGYDAARKTASRLVARGELIRNGPGRPAVLSRAQPTDPADARQIDDIMNAWRRG